MSSSKPIRVLGIDPAFSNVGIAVAELDKGSLHDPKLLDLVLVQTSKDPDTKKKVRKNSDDLRRARESVHAIRDAIAQHKPHLVFAEVPTGSQSARSAWCLGAALGVLASITIPVIELLPREVKEVTGIKHAGKEEIIEWAIARHPDAPWAFHTRGGKKIQTASHNEHLADAVAAVHAGIRTDEFQRVMAFWDSMGGVAL